MPKTKSPPGHEEASLEVLKAEWVSLAQRCTRMETELTKGIRENASCLSTVVVMAIIAILLGVGNAGYLVLEAWS